MESIKKLYSNFPKLQLHIIASDSISREEENSSDILMRPFYDSDNFRKVWYTLYHHGLFASKDYISQMGMPQSVEDLLKHRIVGYGEYKFSYYEDINWHLKGQDYGLPKLKPYLTINSTKAIYSAAQQGLGICSIPIESDKIYDFDRELIRVLPHIAGPTVKSYFCIKKSATGRKLNSINVFNDYFQNYLKGQGVEILLIDN